MPRKVCDDIIYLFPNFNGVTFVVLEWTSNFPTLYDVCDYISMLRLKLTHISKNVAQDRIIS